MLHFFKKSLGAISFFFMGTLFAVSLNVALATETVPSTPPPNAKVVPSFDGVNIDNTWDNGNRERKIEIGGPDGGYTLKIDQREDNVLRSQVRLDGSKPPLQVWAYVGAGGAALFNSKEGTGINATGLVEGIFSYITAQDDQSPKGLKAAVYGAGYDVRAGQHQALSQTGVGVAGIGGLAGVLGLGITQDVLDLYPQSEAKNYGGTSGTGVIGMGDIGVVGGVNPTYNYTTWTFVPSNVSYLGFKTNYIDNDGVTQEKIYGLYTNDEAFIGGGVQTERIVNENGGITIEPNNGKLQIAGTAPLLTMGDDAQLSMGNRSQLFMGNDSLIQILGENAKLDLSDGTLYVKKIVFTDQIYCDNDDPNKCTIVPKGDPNNICEVQPGLCDFTKPGPAPWHPIIRDNIKCAANDSCDLELPCPNDRPNLLDCKAYAVRNSHVVTKYTNRCAIQSPVENGRRRNEDLRLEIRCGN